MKKSPSRNGVPPRGQYLLTAGWDSKKLLDAEAGKHLFGFLTLADADAVDRDPGELVGRVFRIAGADDVRVYLEEVPALRKTRRKKSA